MSESHAFDEPLFVTVQKLGEASPALLRMLADSSPPKTAALNSMKPAIEKLAENATSLQSSLAPHMGKAMDGVRATTPEFARFPEQAARQMNSIIPEGSGVFSNATRWQYLWNRNHDMQNVNELIRNGPWKDNLHYIQTRNLNLDELSAATNASRRALAAGEAVNEGTAAIRKLGEMAEQQHRAYQWRSLGRDMGAFAASQVTNYAADAMLAPVERSRASIAAETALSVVAMSTRLGFVSKYAALSLSHFGARAWDQVHAQK